MNCRDISHRSVPRIPRGNDFKLAVVLKEYVKANGGQVSERDIDIASLTTVAVVRANGDSVVPTYTRNGAAIILDFPQQESAADGLGKGKYGVEITGKRTDGSDFRFFLPLAFYIVESTPEGYFPADSIITYTVDGIVGVAQSVSRGGVTEQWVADNFQPKGNYLTREQLFAATLREMMAIDVRPHHRYQAATVPIAYTVDSSLCLAFYDLGQRQYRDVVFKVRRLGASWQEVEDAVEAAGYEIVRHEMVLLRKGKRKKHMRKNDEGEDIYVRKMKRGYSPLLNDKIDSPLEGLDFSEIDEADVTIRDFILFDDYPIEECTETIGGSFINIVRERIKQDFRMEVWFFGHRRRHSLSFGYITEERVFKGQTYIDCAIAEMVEVKGHRRFYGNLVYGRLYLTVSPIAEYSAYDDVEDKVLTLSFVPRDAVASG